MCLSAWIFRAKIRYIPHRRCERKAWLCRAAVENTTLTALRKICDDRWFHGHCTLVKRRLVGSYRRSWNESWQFYEPKSCDEDVTFFAVSCRRLNDGRLRCDREREFWFRRWRISLVLTELINIPGMIRFQCQLCPLFNSVLTKNFF